MNLQCIGLGCVSLKQLSSNKNAQSYLCLAISAIMNTVLHPTGCKNYMIAQEWPEEWIKDAVEMLRSTYEEFFKAKTCKTTKPPLLNLILKG